MTDTAISTPGIEPGYLTLREFAERQRTTPRTARRWIAAGKIPAVRSLGGRRVLIRVSDVASFEAANPPIPSAVS